jgi:hypothetical protein
MRALRSAGRELLRVALSLFSLGVAAILTAAGAAWAAFGGHGLRNAVASALFIGGAALVVWNGLSGGAAGGRRADIYSTGGRRVAPTAMPFGWVLVGTTVIGLGVLSLVA